MWTSGSEHDADQRRPRRLRVVTSIGGGQLPPGHGGLSGGLRSLALLPPRDHPPPLTPPPHAGKTWGFLSTSIEPKVVKQEQQFRTPSNSPWI